MAESIKNIGQVRPCHAKKTGWIAFDRRGRRSYTPAPIPPPPAFRCHGFVVSFNLNHGRKSGRSDLNTQGESGSIRKILRGTAWLTATSTLSKILLLFFFVFLANRLGKENLGRFAFLLDSAFIVFICTDLGLGYLLVQKVSRHRSATSDLFAGFLGLRLMMVAPFVLLYALFLYFYGQGTDWRAAQALAISYLVLQCFWDLFRSVIRGRERMDQEALSTLIERLVYMGIGVLALSLGFRLNAMMLIAQGSILVSFALIAYWIVRGGTPIRIHFIPSQWPPLLRETLPFGLGALCIIALYREDTLMLNWLRGDAETGIYQAAFRLMEGTLLVPQAVALAAYPTFSRLFHQKEAIRPSAEKLQRWLLVLCLPMMVGGILLTPKVFEFFQSDFIPSVGVLQILLLALPALYLNYLVGTLLRSVDRQIYNLYSAAAALAVNFALNLALIPALGAKGAATATVLTQLVYFLLMYFFLRRTLGGLRLKNYFPLLLLCSAAVGLVVYPLRDAPLYVSVPLGAAVFAAAAFLTRLVSREEIRQFVRFFAKVRKN